MQPSSPSRRNAPFQVRPLSYALGAEVSGLALAEPLSADTTQALREAWHEHHVLLLRGQPLEPEQLLRFARCFGELDPHDSTPHYRLAGFPALLQITNREINGKPSETRNTGRNWHSDYSYTMQPAAGAALYAAELPPVGGDTMFCNMVAAYDSLSEKMREIVEQLDCVFDINLTAGFAERDAAKNAELRKLNPPVAHPAVRVHPDSGRRALYVSERASHFAGMTKAESAPLIEYLCAHATRQENVYRHQWRCHDVLLWDNRSTMHIALSDFDPTATRHMLRATVMGQRSGYLIED